MTDGGRRTTHAVHGADAAAGTSADAAARVGSVALPPAALNWSSNEAAGASGIVIGTPVASTAYLGSLGSPAIINAAKEDLEMMRKAAIKGDVVSFNLALLDIISILQRPVATGDGTGVKRILALSKKDFARIIEREEDLLQAMEGSITGDYTPKKKEDFSQFGIEVYEATDRQRDEVLKHLSPSLKGKVRNVYRVIPGKQKKLFNAYLKKKGIKDMRML